jgi:hypothetical protein
MRNEIQRKKGNFQGAPSHDTSIIGGFSLAKAKLCEDADD